MKTHTATQNILIIPSWFPIHNNRLGSYFEEQFLLLKRENFNVALFYPQLIEQTKKDFIKRLFTQLGKYLFVQNISDGLHTEVNGEAYRIHDYTFLPAHIRYKIVQYIITKRVRNFCKSRNWHPDIIHGFSVFGAGMYTVDIATHMKAKSIITEHQVFNLSYYSKEHQQRIINTLLSVNILNAVSTHLIRLMVSQYIHRSISVFNNYIQDIFFIHKDHVKSLAEPFTIAYVSYNEYIKGDDVFMESLRLFKEKYHVALHINIAGYYDAATINKTKEYFKHASIGTCDFLGKVTGTELVSVFSRSHLLVSTSRAETFGMAVREALAAGLPVVCTRSGGVDEEITPDNGCLVNIDDAEAVSEGIMHVYKNYPQYNPYEISQRIYNKYSSQETIANYNTLYKNVSKLNN